MGSVRRCDDNSRGKVQNVRGDSSVINSARKPSGKQLRASECSDGVLAIARKSDPSIRRTHPAHAEGAWCITVPAGTAKMEIPGNRCPGASRGYRGSLLDCEGSPR